MLLTMRSGKKPCRTPLKIFTTDVKYFAHGEACKLIPGIIWAQFASRIMQVCSHFPLTVWLLLPALRLWHSRSFAALVFSLRGGPSHTSPAWLTVAMLYKRGQGRAFRAGPRRLCFDVWCNTKGAGVGWGGTIRYLPVIPIALLWAQRLWQGPLCSLCLICCVIWERLNVLDNKKLLSAGAFAKNCRAFAGKACM